MNFLKNIFKSNLDNASKILTESQLPNKFLNESYSQHGEDNILFCLLNYKNSGFFVDVGAHHPQRFSNTYKFYKMGYRGINIDPMPNIKKLFDTERPEDINIEVGISDKKDFLDYYMFEETALNSFDLNTVEYFKKIYPDCKMLGTKKIELLRLDEILDENLPQNTKIDFLNIDCEGFDDKVLSSNNWNKYKPKIIIFETGQLNVRQILEEKSTKMLEDLGYEFVAKTVLSSFFALKD